MNDPRARGTSARRRIGYFVGRFGLPVHVFFWREMKALRAIGVEPDVVSSYRPDPEPVQHDWMEQAQTRTTYLMPPRRRGIMRAMRTLADAGPRGWFRCLAAICRARGCSLRERLRLPALAFVGADLAGLARERGWRHIHVHNCTDSAHVALFASLLTGLRYSLTLHNELRFDGPDQPQKWGGAAFATVVSQKLLNDVRAALPGHLPEIVRVAAMGVDLEQFNRGSPYLPWCGEGEFRIFCCGRIDPVKAHDNLIRAIGMLRNGGIPAVLRIAGGTMQRLLWYQRHLEDLISELGLDLEVTLLGTMTESGVRENLEWAHAFALASKSEGLPVSVMEAMAMRVPVVVTRVGGNPELIEDGRQGRLVAPAGADALARALRELAQDPEAARGMGGEGRRRVVCSYHSGVNAAVIADCLDSCRG